MKLLNSYKHGDLKRLKFLNNGQDGIALEFAYRLAAYTEVVANKLKQPNLLFEVGSGYRDTAYQQKLYNDNVRAYPPTGNGKVAQPGRSWHEARCAVDVSTSNATWYNYITNGDYRMAVANQELYAFGLCLPLNLKSGGQVHEWWHIQPVETLSWTNAEHRKRFLDWDDPLNNNAIISVVEFQDWCCITPDGKIGPQTKAIALKVKAQREYSATKIKGVVDAILKA